MYMGYDIETTLGWAPRYDTELNIPSSTLPNTYQSVMQPSQDMMDVGNAMLVFPVLSDVGMIKTVSGAVSIDELALPSDLGRGIHVMDPVMATDVPQGGVVCVITIGAFPIVAVLLCVALIAAIVGFTMVSQYWTSAWVQTHYYEAQEAYYDYLTQCMEVIEDYTVDLNGDGIPDVRHIVWANGRAVALAVSEYGVEHLGGDYEVYDEGDTADPPAEPVLPLDMGWVIIAVAGVIALALILKTTGSGQSQGGGLTILKS